MSIISPNLFIVSWNNDEGTWRAIALCDGAVVGEGLGGSAMGAIETWAMLAEEDKQDDNRDYSLEPGLVEDKETLLRVARDYARARSHYGMSESFEPINKIVGTNDWHFTYDDAVPDVIDLVVTGKRMCRINTKLGTVKGI